MVALADEIFLNADWEGRYAWNFNLLESRLFQSHVAGERFFQNIDQLLEKRSPLRVELAKIYLMALSLGFQGKYRGADPEHALRYYRKRLHSFITLGAEDVGRESRLLFPQAYEHTVRGGEVRRFPSARKWIITLAVAIVVMLGISHLLWTTIISDLHPVLDNIHP
jgi:type VI secretion system protein ImpK